MSDRSTFWPATPDWTSARIEAAGITVTASHGDRRVLLLSGSAKAVQQVVKDHPGTLLQIAPDRAMLVTDAQAGLQDGWHPAGVAISDLSDAHIRLDIRGP